MKLSRYHHDNNEDAADENVGGGGLGFMARPNPLGLSAHDMQMLVQMVGEFHLVFLFFVVCFSSSFVSLAF